MGAKLTAVRSTGTDAERFALRQGHLESLAELAGVSILVNAHMGQVVALAVGGNWEAAYLECAALVRAVGLACECCAERQ
jgi:hypothetical protein